MFNIFEGNTDAKARKLQERLEILKRAREDGFFDEERIEPIPEIVADGHGPDDDGLPGWERMAKAIDKLAERERNLTEHGERCPNPGGNTLEGLPEPQQTNFMWCHNCDVQTNHNGYGRGVDTWHCNICCTCDWCMATVERQATAGKNAAIARQQGREQVAAGHEALHDALTTPVDQLFFCTKCGAGLHCGVCNNKGTGKYCDLCGKNVGEEEFCTDCWKEADSDE